MENCSTCGKSIYWASEKILYCLEKQKEIKGKDYCHRWDKDRVHREEKKKRRIR